MEIKNINIESDASGLYASQLSALQQLSEWWSSTEREATLQGFAGTGKTFLVRYFIEQVVNKSFVVTAPTHKALRVIEEHLGSKGLTLQSLHGLKPNTELSTFDINNLSFDTLGKPKIQHYSLVIIDEASMINKSLRDLNLQRAKEYGVKILYIGDSYQLPPIKESMSTVFTDIKTVIRLDTIIRQKSDNPILKLTALLRYDIDNRTSTFLDYITTNPEQIVSEGGYKKVNTIEYKALMKEYFDNPKFYNNIDYVRAMAYTNLMVNSWNLFIRETIHETKGMSIIQDDLLTSYTTLVDDNNSPILVNSEDYIIEQIRPYRNEYQLDVHCVVLKSAFTKKNTQMLQIIDHNNEESFNHYKNLLGALRRKAKEVGGKRGWYPYFKFKNTVLSMQDVDIAGLKVTRDIDYGYTLTTHKLQGSTFENIFIDGLDICHPMTKWGKTRPNDIDIRNRLLYVAVSRAKNMVFIKF